MLCTWLSVSLLAGCDVRWVRQDGKCEVLQEESQEINQRPCIPPSVHTVLLAH